MILLLLFIPAIIFSKDMAGDLFLGNLNDYETVSHPLVISNSETNNLNITFFSLCDCLEIEPLTAIIKAGESLTFNIKLTPEGYDYMSRHLLVDRNGEKSTLKVWVNLPEKPVELLSNGCPECLIKEKELQDIETSENILKSWVVTDIYYSPGCSTCEEFIDDLDENTSINKHNILESKELEQLEGRLKELNTSLEAFPIVISRNRVLQGKNVTIKNYNTIIDYNSVSRVENKSRLDYLKPLPILLAGLLDGVNPCAFTTLLFLISSLFYIGRGKKEILKTGLVFTVTIFLSYYLVGLGMLNIVRTATLFPIISSVIKVILIIGLILLGVLSFYDAYKVKKGLLSDIKLQLPKSLKKRIHRVIKQNTRNNGLIVGTVVIGIMVTIFELTCTGQVYLPIITYIINIEGSISSYVYLTLYNIGFIIPLLVVFLAVYKGTTNQKLSLWFGNKLFVIKILLGILFLGMIPFI